MKKLVITTLALGILSATAFPALALRWPDNLSRRVGAMGGASLAVEDETTQVNPFNHQNIAGLAELPKMNRIDAGLGLTSSLYKEEQNGYQSQTTTHGFEFTRPNTEYRGVTYWLDNNLILRAGIEAMTLSAKQTTTGLPDEGFAFSGLGGGAGLVYKTDFGLALGAGLTYTGAGGKPDSLTGTYNVFQNDAGTTEKLELSATNLDWSAGAAYEFTNLGASDNKLQLGIQASADDGLPNTSDLVSSIQSGNPSPQALGDYAAVANISGTLPTGAVTNKYTFTPSPLVVSGEAVFNLGTLINAGLLLDVKSSAIQSKSEYTGYPNNYFVNTEYKASDESATAVTPVIRAKILLDEDLTLLAGLRYSTYGSATIKNYSLNGLTNAVNDTYKSSQVEISSGTLGVGAGLQALSNQLQLALQYENGADTTDTTSYLMSTGAALPVQEVNATRNNFRVGAEYWLLPFVALRAGLATLATTTLNGHYNLNAQRYEDLTSTTNLITAGAGFSMPEGLAVDLLLEFSSAFQTPAPDPVPTDTATNIYLGMRIPI